MDIIDILKESLIGKKIRHKNTYNREVDLVVEDVEVSSHHRQITPDTPQNDWWGESCSWETIRIKFTDGSSKDVTLKSAINIVE